LPPGLTSLLHTRGFFTEDGGFMDKRIYIAGEITDESFIEFSETLRHIENKSKYLASVTVEICSGGGDAYAGLAYFDRIRGSKMKIIGEVYGQALSAATTIFLACHERYMSPSSYLLLHEEAGNDKGSVTARERSIFNSRILEDHHCKLFSEVTNVSFLEWKEMNKNETYLSTEECLKKGLINGVL